MYDRVLITGGAGFIGLHLANTLLKKGYKVRILDNLDPQVHSDKSPKNIPHTAEFILGDVTDREILRETLKKVDTVFHLAALTGVGQSMYQVTKYINTNVLGTAQLLDIVANEKHSIQKIILASSRAVYGEGKYHCEQCGVVYPGTRQANQLKNKNWDVNCPKCNSPISWLPTDEGSPSKPASLYALSKTTQEELCRIIGSSYGIPTMILRFFNVFGPGQTPSNPYTGVLTAFIVKSLKGETIEVYEDGQETRDFVHVEDVVQACVLVLESEITNLRTFNIGTGLPVTIGEIAHLIAQKSGNKSAVRINPVARIGDIRHCVADISAARKLLKYEPRKSIDNSLGELFEWINREMICDLSTFATKELFDRGLLLNGTDL